MSNVERKRSLTRLVDSSSPTVSRRVREEEDVEDEEDRRMMKKEEKSHAILKKDSFLHYFLFFLILAIIIYLIFYFFKFPFVQNKDLSGAYTGDINQGKAIGWAIGISLVIVVLVYLLMVPRHKY